MKKFKIIVLSLLLFCSCEKDAEDAKELNIYGYDWVLQTINSEKINRTEFSLNKAAYVLNFINDTVFELNTSANKAGGNYYRITENKILVKNYHEYTEVYNLNDKERDIDDMLLNSLNDTFNFSYSENKLVLQKNTLTIICTVKEQ